MGENYPHESLKLFSQSVRGCAIIHVGFLSLVFVTPHYTGFIEGKPLSFPENAYFAAGAESRGILPGMAHGDWRCSMRISRIPAESGKALEPRRDGKTAHNRQQPRYLAIISRRLAHLNEEWGKSSEIAHLRFAFEYATLATVSSGPGLPKRRGVTHFSFGTKGMKDEKAIVSNGSRGFRCGFR
jgi:hypothetical protein